MKAPDEFFTVHHGDARRLSKLLEPHSSQRDPLLTATITSPPYADLKNYDHPDQIGWGQPYDEYLVEMRRIFRAVAQHTRPDGCMWVIADTLLSDERGLGGMPRRLEPLPFQLATEAADSGWILRETIIWQKDKTLPWSSSRRLRNAFEYVLLFVRGPQYKFYVDRLRDPIQLEEWWVKWPERYNPLGKVPSNVWEIPIPVQGSWKTAPVQHACPLPPDLVERLIYLSSDPGDVVFDPLAGTGVVVAEAERLGRRGLGIELKKGYVGAFARAVRPEIMKRSKDDELTARMQRSEHLRRAIPKLRALKLAKVMVQEVAKAESALPRVKLVALVVGRIGPKTIIDPTCPLDVEMTFAVDASGAEQDRVRQLLKEALDRPPASKFGISAGVTVCRPKDLSSVLTRKRFHLYTKGRTWDAVGTARLHDLEALADQEWPTRKGDYSYPAIVSNVEVHEDPGDT